MKAQRPEAVSAAHASPTAPATISLSRAVWAYLESIPGLAKRIAKADAQIEAGEGTPIKDLRRGS